VAEVAELKVLPHQLQVVQVVAEQEAVLQQQLEPPILEAVEAVEQQAALVVAVLL
jgi:hypothetical protein